MQSKEYFDCAQIEHITTHLWLFHEEISKEIADTFDWVWNGNVSDGFGDFKMINETLPKLKLGAFYWIRNNDEI